MATIRFEPNIPVDLALKYDEGRFTEGKRDYIGRDGKPRKLPDQMMYTTVNGDQFYLDLPQSEEFEKLGIRRGEPVSICKRVINRVPSWEFQRLSDASEPSHEHRPAAAGGFEKLPTEINATPLERKLTESVNQVRARRAVSQATPAAAPAQNTQPSAPPHNGTAAAGQTRSSAIMGAALIAAIDATLLAERYAESKGMDVAFGPEDYRAIAATLYIQACKDPLFAERVNAGGAQQWQH